MVSIEAVGVQIDGAQERKPGRFSLPGCPAQYTQVIVSADEFWFELKCALQVETRRDRVAGQKTHPAQQITGLRIVVS